VRAADPDWLDDEEQEAWRAFVHGSTQVIRLLERDLLERHDLSIDDYGLLAKLSEAPDERLRFGDLADVLHLPKANLTYRFKRLEAAGLVERQDCDTDRRGAFACLTRLGRKRLDEAAPDHVAAVRRHVIAPLSRTQLRQVGQAMAELLATAKKQAPQG
jgi:DNA-binding MarR family transcriptional regulator